MTRRLLLCLMILMALLTGCGTPVESAEASAAVTEFQIPLYTDATPAVLWGRQQLSAHAQAAYDDMSVAIACHQEGPLVVDADNDEIPLILTALRIDHPEYFWFDGEASFVTTTLAGHKIRTECTFSYTMPLEDIQAAHQQVQQYATACLSSPEVAGAQDDYQRILGVYRYIIGHTDYVLSETDQSIVSVMGRNQATCAGYARSFQYLMSQLGIPCTLALGQGTSGESHGWNMVQCDGDWYQMDVTWGDPVGPDDLPGDGIQYTYFLVTDQEIYRDHTLDCDLPMPVCTATRDNYFIRSGLQYDSWDLDAFDRALGRCAQAGEEWFSVRFSNRETYDSAVNTLFRDGAIWEVLQRWDATLDSQTRVTYTQNDLFYEISVQLDGNIHTGRDNS